MPGENSTCGREPMYQKWDALYRKGWNNTTSGVMVAQFPMQFDGGLEHKDGSRWAIAKVVPGFDILKIQLSTAGLQAANSSDPVTVDLGCVSYERDCNCDPVCADFGKLFSDVDVSAAYCDDLPCGPWNCRESCMPECCPVRKPAAGCCPPEEMPKACGLSDLVLTLHGTPAACSKLDMLIWYQAG